MALEEVFQANAQYRYTNGLEATFKDNSDNSDVIAAMNMGYRDLNEAERDRALQKTSYQIDDRIKTAKKHAEDLLVATVEQNYGDVLKNMPDLALYHAVRALAPATDTGDAVHDKIAKIQKKIMKFEEDAKNNKVDAYMEDLEKRNPAFYADLMLEVRMDPNAAKGLANYRKTRLMQEFERNFSVADAEEPTINRAKLLGYLAKNMAAYDDKKKKKAYLELGKYMQVAED